MWPTIRKGIVAGTAGIALLSPFFLGGNKSAEAEKAGVVADPGFAKRR